MTKTFCDVCGQETKKVRRILFPTNLDNIDLGEVSEVAEYRGANLVFHTVRDICPICDSMISAMEEKFFNDIREQSLFYQEVESKSLQD